MSHPIINDGGDATPHLGGTLLGLKAAVLLDPKDIEHVGIGLHAALVFGAFIENWHWYLAPTTQSPSLRENY